MKIKLLFLLLGVVTITMVLLQYHGHADVDGYSVDDVLANPRPLIGHEITVSGVAGDRLSILGTGFFQLVDLKPKGEGRLTVLSNQGMPQTGKQVTVHGTLQQVYAAGARDALVLIESAQSQSQDPSNTR